MAFEDAAQGDGFPPAGGGGSPGDVRRVFSVLRRFWWIPILTALAGGGLAQVYFGTVKPEFRSTAEIRVERRAAMTAAEGGSTALEGATTTEDLKTIEASFLNDKVMEGVLAMLHSRDKEGLLGGGATEGKAALWKFSSVALVPETRLIAVSFENGNPSLAQKVAQALAEKGIEQDRAQRVEALGGNVELLKAEAAKLEAGLREGEEKFHHEMGLLGSVSIDEQNNIEIDQLRDLNSRLVQAKSERLKLESDYEQIQACLNDPDKLLAIESIAKVPAVERLYLRAGELRGQLVKLAQRYGPDNPLMVQTQTELREVEKTLRQEILQAPRSVEVALSAARRNEEGTSREQAAQEKRAIELKQRSLNAGLLRRQIEADKISYANTLTKLNEEIAQSRSQPVLLQLVQPAGPAIPVGVTRAKVLAVGGMGGLMLGAALVFLLLQLDTSLKTTEDAEAAFSLPVLAAVPEYEVSGKKEAGELALSPILGEPYSQAAEAFRALRTTLLSRDGEEGRLILVTSALPGEGKSFCALNLGVVLAQTGQRTLLVDAQLRHPVLAHRVIGGAGGQGLSDYLQGTAGFSSVVCGTTVPNLDLVPSGSPTAHPAELLSRQRLSEFTAEALQHYDRVVFDSASIQLVSDTLGFARFFPVVCLVLRAGKTARQILARTLDQIERAGVKPLGLILNRTSGKIAPAVASALHPTEVEPPPGFPLACPGCGRVYRSAEDFLLVTRTAGDHARNAPHGALQLVRECVCGMALGVPTHTRRDFTDMGNKRRRIFGNLHKALIASGFPQEDARDKLLLILKVWRNETGGERENEDSEAAERRSALFDQLADGLATDGESREEARGRLREAIRMWREVP